MYCTCYTMLNIWAFTCLCSITPSFRITRKCTYSCIVLYLYKALKVNQYLSYFYTWYNVHKHIKYLIKTYVYVYAGKQLCWGVWTITNIRIATFRCTHSNITSIRKSIVLYT